MELNKLVHELTKDKAKLRKVVKEYDYCGLWKNINEHCNDKEFYLKLYMRGFNMVTDNSKELSEYPVYIISKEQWSE